MTWTDQAHAWNAEPADIVDARSVSLCRRRERSRVGPPWLYISYLLYNIRTDIYHSKRTQDREGEAEAGAPALGVVYRRWVAGLVARWLTGFVMKGEEYTVNLTLRVTRAEPRPGHGAGPGRSPLQKEAP